MQALRTRLRELAKERRRFGYRRLHILLKREGWAINHKKLYRIYQSEGLAVKKRKGRKRAIGTRAPLPSAIRCNHIWSLATAPACGVLYYMMRSRPQVSERNE